MMIFGSCAATYGNPSGHAGFSAAMYITLFLMIFHDKDHMAVERAVVRSSINYSDPFRSSLIVNTETSRWQKMIKNRVAYVVGLLITAFMVIGIGVSRFMLGAHSIDQVLYGWTYGIWMAFFMWRYVRPRVSVHLRRILESD